MKIDDVLDGVKTTMIKMDIEGVELNALNGAENIIKKLRPKLVVCLYHKPEDIVEIPAYLLSLEARYSLFIRHLIAGMTDTILFAVPN